MKKILSLVIVAAVLLTSCTKQGPGGDLANPQTFEDNVNGGGGSNTKSVAAAVLAAFNARYPDAARIQWKLLSDGNYKAEFFRGAVKWQATFSPTGSLLKEEHV